MEYNKQQLDCESVSPSHRCSSMPFPGVSAIQRKSGTKIELANYYFLLSQLLFSLPKAVHRYSNTEKEEIDRRRRRATL